MLGEPTVNVDLGRWEVAPQAWALAVELPTRSRPARAAHAVASLAWYRTQA